MGDKRRFYAVAVVMFLSLAVAAVMLKPARTASWHEEIYPTTQLSRIAGEGVLALPDGEYPLAMPPEGLQVNGKSPLLLVKVDGEYYPLNIADDSILPRRGKRLELRILFGFTSRHAQNTLRYAEKINDDPVADYSKKAFYFLEVRNGFGEVRRGYKR